MKCSLFVYLCLFVSVVSVSSCGSSGKASGPEQPPSFIAPGYVKQDYKKILVVARLNQDIYRKRVENALISEFKDHRITLHPSYGFLTPELMKDTLALREKLVAEGFDAVLALTNLGQMTNISEQYKYNGNMYSFYGYSYTVLDLDTRSNKTAYFQCDFFVKDKLGTQWRAPVAVPIRDLDIAEQELAMRTRKLIVADKIL